MIASYLKGFSKRKMNIFFRFGDNYVFCIVCANLENDDVISNSHYRIVIVKYRTKNTSRNIVQSCVLESWHQKCRSQKKLHDINIFYLKQNQFAFAFLFLQTKRTPIHCYERYQRSLNKNLLKRCSD